MADDLPISRDQLLADVCRALRECYPDRAERMIADLERRIPSPDRTFARELVFSATITPKQEALDEIYFPVVHDGPSPPNDALGEFVHAIALGLNEVEKKRVSGVDYMLQIGVTAVPSGGRPMYRVDIVAIPR
jgi:hypothetical protein